MSVTISASVSVQDGDITASDRNVASITQTGDGFDFFTVACPDASEQSITFDELTTPHVLFVKNASTTAATIAVGLFLTGATRVFADMAPGESAGPIPLPSSPAVDLRATASGAAGILVVFATEA